ncbi:hypothetical protein KM043_000945 [Ampulex compressa]|nr:hypothetical protein KM043_000945 [Ampulex compressa]
MAKPVGTIEPENPILPDAESEEFRKEEERAPEDAPSIARPTDAELRSEGRGSPGGGKEENDPGERPRCLDLGDLSSRSPDASSEAGFLGAAHERACTAAVPWREILLPRAAHRSREEFLLLSSPGLSSERADGTRTKSPSSDPSSLRGRRFEMRDRRLARG